ncbi:2,3-epoxybenzoyl-CoA dihydrolase [Actinomadura sp. ATCC 31491]|uniref:2,3-epoxybenzoyl-CoA dihydrolase n=1 Tax=Actinomadura luzonensis TaxID=2805427 RepID=A0ABT0G2D8_9ACTN|nr:2,3-epoxybenzoyl-CoA dihydrolase [Actinomadura luzonensis]MCK2218772.1 2,3-epoxybenzoyl-CoA dihydrolase [Actinomadura luzonensis]
MTVSFATSPDRYRHWTLRVDGPVATVTLRVDEQGGLVPGYELKMNSYDLGVDIELYDLTQRLRFEHPGVKAVVLTGGLERMFCAGANIRMLAQSSHAWKVNFCKFTNETRNGIEDAGEHSGQTWIAALNGTAAGGGYELALACDEIVLVDDGSSAVSLPEVSLLGVLPGTGGLTRLTDKRHVRRDLADVFATRPEGLRGPAAVAWGLVDAAVPRHAFAAEVARRAAGAAARSARPSGAAGVPLTPLEREDGDGDGDGGDVIRYPYVSARLDRAGRRADITVTGPPGPPPADPVTEGAAYWPLAVTRALDDLILHLRANEPALGIWVLRATGDPALVLAHDARLREADDWFASEVRHYYKRTLKRLDVTSRSLVAVLDPGTAFAGLLAELALAADRQYMLEGVREDRDDGPAALWLTPSNDGLYPMGNGLSRLGSRFWGRDGELAAVRARFGEPLEAAASARLGLVTLALDDLDFAEELRLALEERASLSPDALTGMEASHRFAGPETMETKIFGRLSAWQNWIFSRPNAAGPDGALRRYGTGRKGDYDLTRV